MTTNDFDPTTNRIPFGLLNEDEQTALIHWPHGWQAYKGCEWVSIASSNWNESVVYRGKPKPPVVKSRYYNLYASAELGIHNVSRNEADRFADPHRTAVLRIDTCNGVLTAHLEEI